MSYVIDDNNSKTPIDAKFKVLASNIFGISAENYNHNQTLVIDPVNWATYYGGSDTDVGRGIMVDVNGGCVVVGSTNSTTTIATLGAYQTSNNGSTDVFMVKFSTNGVRLWATYYGSSSTDDGFGITTDANGNLFITGKTFSSNAMATPGAHQVIYGGNNDAFLAKFDSIGIRQWATYYGGSAEELAIGIAADINGNVLLEGRTASTTAIATLGAHQTIHGGGFYDVFVAKFNTNGLRLWATYYGGGTKITQEELH